MHNAAALRSDLQTAVWKISGYPRVHGKVEVCQLVFAWQMECAVKGLVREECSSRYTQTATHISRIKPGESGAIQLPMVAVERQRSAREWMAGECWPADKDPPSLS